MVATGENLSTSDGSGLLALKLEGARTVAAPEVLPPEQSPQFPRQSADGPRNDQNPATLGSPTFALLFRTFGMVRH